MKRDHDIWHEVFRWLGMLTDVTIERTLARRAATLLSKTVLAFLPKSWKPEMSLVLTDLDAQLKELKFAQKRLEGQFKN